MHNLPSKVKNLKKKNLGGFFLLSPLFFFFALSLKAENYFTLRGSISLNYQKKNYSILRSTAKEVQKSANLYLYFESFFWSKRFLNYGINLNLEKGQIENGIISGKTENLGYGINLKFFPQSKKKFSLFLYRGNYLYEKEEGIDYDRKINGYGFEFFFDKISGFYKFMEFKVPFFEQDERGIEEGNIKTKFKWNKNLIFTEIRRNIFEYKYFNTKQRLDSANFVLTSSLDKINYNLNLYYNEFSFEDKEINFTQDLKFLNLSGNFGKDFSRNLNSNFILRYNNILNSQEIYNLEEILRYKATKSFKIETIFGYLDFKDNFSKKGNSYYLGSGFNFNLNIYKAAFYLRAGALWRNYNFNSFEGKQLAPYGILSFSLETKKFQNKIEVNYYGFNYKNMDISIDELPYYTEEISILSKEDLFLKNEFLFHDHNIYSISLKSYYNKFKKEPLKGIESLYISHMHQGDLNFYFLNIGVKYYEGEEREKNFKIKLREGHFSLKIMNNFSLMGSNILREKNFEFGKEEREKNLKGVYNIGKFSLILWYQVLEDFYLTSNKKTEYFRLVILRNF